MKTNNIFLLQLRFVTTAILIINRKVDILQLNLIYLDEIG
jgi:hypothetical protein